MDGSSIKYGYEKLSSGLLLVNFTIAINQYIKWLPAPPDQVELSNLHTSGEQWLQI